MDNEIENIEKSPNIMDIFNELSFQEKWKKVFYGLKQPKDSGDYKYAKLQLLRLSAPLAAIAVPCLALALLITLAAIKPPPRAVAQVRIIQPEEPPELEEIEEIHEEPIEPPDPIDMDFTPDVALNNIATPGPVADFSPQPAKFDTVAVIKSPCHYARNVQQQKSWRAR